MLSVHVLEYLSVAVRGCSKVSIIQFYNHFLFQIWYEKQMEIGMYIL